MQETISYIDQILVFVIFGVGLNLVLGYTGILQTAPAAFGAIGGYSLLYLTGHHWSFVVAVLVGVGCAVALGLIVGLPVLRLEGLWVLLLTLSVGLVVIAALEGLNAFGGAYGLQSDSGFSLFGLGLNQPSEVLPLDAIFAILVLGFGWLVGESPFGRVLRGIRGDESAVRALGKNVFSFKLIVFVISAGLSGLAGSLLSATTQVANPNQFNFQASVQIVAVVIIGGLGSLTGTVLGAIVVVLLTPFFQDVIHLSTTNSAIVQLIAYGAALTAVVYFRPAGIIPEGASFAKLVGLLGGPTQAGGEPALATGLAGAGTSNGSAGVIPGPGPGIAEAPVATRPTPSGSAPASTVVETKPAPAVVLADRSAVVEVHGVSKAFGGVKAVNELSMTLREGAITALVGPNGAGKTTVFNLLTGALPLDGGRVLLRGQDITLLRPDQIAGLGMVRTFQDVRLFSGLSVLDNVLLGIQRQPGERLSSVLARPLSCRRAVREARDEALHWLEFVGMRETSKAQVGTLGYGDQKLVALARLLATQAEVLLLDEPASGIDYQRLDNMLEVVSRLREEGRTVCIVEHNLDVVGRLADHVYFMELGRVTAEGDFTELTSDPRLAEAYFGVS